MSSSLGARTRRTPRLALAAVTIAGLSAATLVAAAPADAASPVHGVVTYDGHAVADIDVDLMRLDASSNAWVQVDGETTDSHGAWTVSTALSDGQYAVVYDPRDASGAPYAALQDSTGSSAPSIYLHPARTFTVASGVPSSTVVNRALAHTGGVIRVATKTASGGSLGSDATALDPLVEFTSASSLFSVIASAPSSGPSLTIEQSSGVYPGYLQLAHVIPGAYGYGVVEASGYASTIVDPITAKAGATTTATVYMEDDTAPSLSTPSSAVTVSGDMKVGSKLTAHAPNTSTPSEKTYSWYAVNLDTALFAGLSFPFTPIPGATGPTFTPTVNQMGRGVVAFVTYRAPGYQDAVNGPDEVAFIGGLIAPVSAGDPIVRSVVVSGTPKLGHTLTAKLGPSVVAGTQSAFRWLRDGKMLVGENGSKHIVTKADYGHVLTARIISTAQGHTDAVNYSRPIAIKDSLGLKAKVSGSTITVTITKGVSKHSTHGTIKVYYSAKKFKTIVVGKHTTYSVKVKVAKGTHRIRIVYSGSAAYKGKTIRVSI